MLSATTNTLKPFYIRALNRCIQIHSPSSISLLKHQYRFKQIGTKPQFRSQSTLNPSIHSIDSINNTNDEQYKKSNNNIQTSLKTSLNDNLIPYYLSETYWWAYINPNAVKFWERQWLVDAILWGNFNTLKTHAIHEINSYKNTMDNKALNITQIACVYGNFSTDLISHLSYMDSYNGINYKIIDIAPIQLINTKNKIDKYLNDNIHSNNNINIDLYQCNSMNMDLINDNNEDITYLFFLLHEQPKDVRLKTIKETIRITKHNGKIIIIDYHKPISNINPFKYIMKPILTYLEPFAIDLWNEQIIDYVQQIQIDNKWNISMEKTLHFNGLYQKIVLTKH